MANLHPAVRLESILSESVASARERERSAFDQLSAPSTNSLVIYGAGNLGRSVLQGLRKNELDAIAFADANPALSGKQIEGIPVFSPQEAAKKYGNGSTFVVCVWHPDRHRGLQHIVDRLRGLGSRTVVPFPFLFWKLSKTFLPHYYWDLPSKILARKAEIWRAYETYINEESRTQFVRDLDLRLHARFYERALCSSEKQYFPSDLFRISPDECFVDCGAYDGDTIREFVAETGGQFRRVIAFEADPQNFIRMQNSLAAIPEIRERVTIHQAAVGSRSGTLRFAATAGSNASVSASGDLVVSCISLDEAVNGEVPTYLKMDIEGSELDALEGATQVISAYRPLLAVCTYHCPDHLWKVPLWLGNAEPEARIYLRSYAVDGWESVCYAVPPRRAI